jgi:D-mannonate dehydratase
MKITKRRLRQIIREELTLERDGVASMSDAERAAVRKELHRQTKEMRQIQRRIEELEPHIEELEAEYDRLMAENESFEEVDFDSMPQAEAEEFLEQMEANLEAADAIDEEIAPFSEELAALYSERESLGISMSAIARAQTP